MENSGKILLKARQCFVSGVWQEKIQVLVDEGVIRQMGSWGSFPEEGSRVEKGEVLLPGLVDCHTHIGLLDPTNPAGDDVNEMIDPVNPGLRVIDGIHTAASDFGDALAEGVTTVGVLPGSTNLLGGQGAALSTAPGNLAQRLLVPYAGQKAALGENPKRDYTAQNRPPRTRMGEAYLLREALCMAREVLRDQGTADLNTQALIPVLEGRVPLRIHAHRSDDIETALRIGAEFGLQLVLEHGTGSAELAERIRDYGATVAVGPVLMSRCKDEMRELDPALAGILEAVGVPVALITDAPELPAGSLRLMAMLAHREGLSAEGALRAITQVPAQILGLEGVAGTIAPGARADLVWMDGDPLDLYSRVRKVYIKGVCVISGNL